MEGDANPVELGNMLFLNPPGDLGNIQIAAHSTDNEYVTQVLLNLLNAGLNTIDCDFKDLIDEELRNSVNERISYIGFNVKAEIASSEDEFVHECCTREAILVHKKHLFL